MSTEHAFYVVVAEYCTLHSQSRSILRIALHSAWEVARHCLLHPANLVHPLLGVD